MKLRFLAGAALGYVFGTRAGRQRYDQILGSLRDLTDSELARQIKDEVGKLTGGITRAQDARGAVTPPVIVGPAPDGKTGTKAADVALPDLETSSAKSGSGDVPSAGGSGTDSATRLDPPTAG